MKIIFATNNKNKLNEIQGLLGPDFQLLSLNDMGYKSEVPENHKTLEDNAIGKARHIYRIYKIDTFADDTGLEIEALNGEPGVYSARYAGKEKSSNANIEKVLNKLHHITNRNAQFRTVISLICQGKEFIFEGTVKGKITEEKYGNFGFGYDPIFRPDGFNKTFAEMSIRDKNRISHRAIAIKKLVHFLVQIQHKSTMHK
jgi:XTP/dITP diphosphohydrolase